MPGADYYPSDRPTVFPKVHPEFRSVAAKVNKKNDPYVYRTLRRPYSPPNIGKSDYSETALRSSAPTGPPRRLRKLPMPPDAQPGSSFRPFAMPVRQRSGRCGCQAVRKAKNYDRAPCAGPDDCADLPDRPPRPSAVRPRPALVAYRAGRCAEADGFARSRPCPGMPAVREAGRSDDREVRWPRDWWSGGRKIRRSRGQVAKRSGGQEVGRSEDQKIRIRKKSEGRPHVVSDRARFAAGAAQRNVRNASGMRLLLRSANAGHPPRNRLCEIAAPEAAGTEAATAGVRKKTYRS